MTKENNNISKIITSHKGVADKDAKSQGNIAIVIKVKILGPFRKSSCFIVLVQAYPPKGKCPKIGTVFFYEVIR